MKRSEARVVFGCASVLLSYPEGNYAEDLIAVADALGRLPKGSVTSRLERTRAWLAGMSRMEAAASYVEVFDLRRRRTLHLTYYRHGDTRERGMALAALIEAYRQAGVRVVPNELPDFLPALLELAAQSSTGAALLREHRAAIDTLSVDLASEDSPYAETVSAVGDTLGVPSRADREAVHRYRAQGPPSERVGLEPFAPPEFVAMGPTRR